jgi:hypothetical protein
VRWQGGDKNNTALGCLHDGQSLGSQSLVSQCVAVVAVVGACDGCDRGHDGTLPAMVWTVDSAQGREVGETAVERCEEEASKRRPAGKSQRRSHSWCLLGGGLRAPNPRRTATP